jgi:hypothetical protein
MLLLLLLRGVATPSSGLSSRRGSRSSVLRCRRTVRVCFRVHALHELLLLVLLSQHQGRNHCCRLCKQLLLAAWRLLLPLLLGVAGGASKQAAPQPALLRMAHATREWQLLHQPAATGRHWRCCGRSQPAALRRRRLLLLHQHLLPLQLLLPALLHRRLLHRRLLLLLLLLLQLGNQASRLLLLCCLAKRARSPRCCRGCVPPAGCCCCCLCHCR